MERQPAKQEEHGFYREPCGLSVADCLGSKRIQSFCSIAGWMHQMLDQMLEGMLVLNLDLSIEIANRAAAHIFGYRPDELLGRPLTSLLQTPEQISIPSIDFPHRPAKCLGFAAGRHEALGCRKDGEIFPI
ncbi:PAS domain-containing protein [Verrucomicrobium sp. 3C]|uniref:PAS domain-containing protein n=1 Tax=Verrucomicrobium sp. 3C TaxID=1134055 RepID=UPI0018CA1B63|nr:PAS domain-containing protein [Verrucomicrobium sp. 3C]